MLLSQTPAMRPWTVEVGTRHATFFGTSHVDDHTAARALPRVWSGRGLGVHENDLPGLRTALAEVMKTTNYWRARSERFADPDQPALVEWSPPARDAEDGFLYFAGPADPASGLPGYRPVQCFTLALPDVRSLRIRVTAYRADQPPSMWSSAPVV